MVFTKDGGKPRIISFITVGNAAGIGAQYHRSMPVINSCNYAGDSRSR
jgi:hypothetical protein